MAMQDRAIRTRRKILEAAATVFGNRGYQAATIADILSTAGVTKGALYFHFASKEQLAQGVLSAQEGQDPVPSRTCKAQELVDMIMIYVHRLQTDSMVRAGVWLALNQQAVDLDRSGPFLSWSETLTELLEAAREQGELLPHVKPAETARVIVGAFAGVQAMSQTLSDYEDLGERIAELLRHVLPNVVISSVLASVALDGDRGTKVSAEIAAGAEQQQLEAIGG
ncbi:ScbR family autoregulator-binding transcription factor [Streptomyces ovatisporus]|uniref:ScbR family autoregulator-binding transcription factor n=1 Tax=Streptomyces ovatisporus TaxID=1128682 RepID=A0ABV9A9Z7_9ACTN